MSIGGAPKPAAKPSPKFTALPSESFSDADVLMFGPVYALLANGKPVDAAARIKAMGDVPTQQRCAGYLKFLKDAPVAVKEEYKQRYLRLNEARIAEVQAKNQKTFLSLQSTLAKQAKIERDIAQLDIQEQQVRAQMSESAKKAAEDLVSGTRSRSKTPA